ncbi:hypothetical protein M404DRAFT_20483 [Pisolithus tinctorius Marx 270]|uniref:Uncharacterized protein n=1 Tax=Pisolithus tinctorius Marx 270 TaxID=870435 RepID=A0A0C3PS28_PISTI|nr:hypothetical protein M404DRAFT_20483 [Pisolithus tinctorius Marx 270]
MAPKHDVSQSKEASPSKQMRITTLSPTTTTSRPPDPKPAIEQNTPPAVLPTTPSPLLEPVSNDQPSTRKPIPSSTTSTDTLPSSSASIQMASASSQPTPPTNTQLQPTVMQGTIGAVRPTPDTSLFNPDRISTCPEPLVK